MPRRGKRLTRHSVVNVVGQTLPLVAALFTYPILVSSLGEARFGALALAWLLTGYASIFDFGIGRALTQSVARKIARGGQGEIARITWTSLLSMLATGTVAAVVMYALAPLFVNELIDAGPALASETTRSLRLIAAFLPIVIITTGVRGVLEAYHDFVTINFVRIPAGLMNYVGPLLVLPFTTDLTYVVLVLIVVRSLETSTYFALCARKVPFFFAEVRFDLATFRDLLSFGSWMTVSNIIAPLMLSFDRFVIAALLSLSAVAYYTTPYSMVTKLRVITSGVMGVLFPAFAEELVAGSAKARRIYFASIAAMAAILIPPVAVIVVFAQPAIALWLSPEFAERSFRVAQILAVGVLIHGLGQPAFTLVQAAGKPDWTAKLHMAEVPLYAAYLLPLIHAHGIVGAAIAWLLRVSISTSVLVTLAHRMLSGLASEKLATLHE